MTDSQPSRGASGRLLALSAKLNGAETVETAITRTMELVETAFDRPVASVSTHDPATDTTTIVEAAVPSSARVDGVPDRMPGALVERMDERRDGPSADGIPEATVDADPGGALRAEVLVPVGRDRVLRVGVTDPDGFDDAGIATVEGIAANLETALSRIDHRRSAAVDRDVARALFDRSDDATFVSDTDGTLVAVNRAAVELTGRDRDALLTSGLPDIAGDTAAETVREHLETTVTGASTSSTMTLERAHGADRSIELTSQRFAVHGTNYIRTIAHDPPAGRRPQPRRSGGPVEDDATAFRRLNELTAGAKAFDETIERLLSLGCEYFGLETGILSHVDGNEYTIDNVVDATGTHEAGAVYELGETMCDATLAGDATESLAFTDVADTEHRNHPAAEDVHAYIAAPVVVDGDTYGTVNFSMGRPRVNAVDQAEREFVKQIARWIGVEIERRRRFEELERYETILEAVDDPVYALDADGRFTFVNSAAEREFGYDETVLGKTPSIGMRESDLERVRGQIDDLIATDERSKTAEFVLETADGGHRVVENRIALLSDDEFRGTAGVLRDVTARNERRQKLESFQRAIEEAVDGVAVLEDGTYTYVDRTHVEMYGFDDTDELLGDTWRKLYDDEEVARLEAEAFPALESEGHWRGMVTGRRPDGSTFPAELSLTIVDDGRLVCTVRDETERQARQRELELKERAMNEADVGIQITDPTKEDNPLVYVNDGFERMTGYTREAVLGRNPRILQGEDTDSERVARLNEAIDAGEPVSTELRNERKDGTPYWSRISLTPVTDEGGAVRNFIGIQQDVTERRERSQWLQRFLDRGPLMFIQTRRDDGEVVVDWCSDRFLDRLGYAEGEIVGEPLASLYTADSAADLREGGYEDALAGGFELDERTLVNADGEPVHTLLRAVPRQDETTGTSALFVDISDRKARAKRTEARRDFLKRIYEVTADPELSFEQKITGLLEAGRDHLDLPYGFLTRIERGDQGEADTQTIVEALGSHELLQPGKSTPLEQSYCRKTVEQGDPMETTHAAEERWADDPAYETFGFETYIGGEVVAGDDPYGTLCFASKEPRDHHFDEFERSFVRLVGRWAGYEIERRNTRENLREQRERLELTLSGTNTGLVEWDLETDAVTWNETLVDIVGRDVDSIEEFIAAIHPDDRDRIQQELETMVETGDTWAGEFRILAADGDTLWLETRATPIHDGDGEPVRVFATGSDISERKRKERERLRNERRFESLFDDPGILMGLLDTDGRLLDVNGTAMEYVDVTHEELRGEPFWEAPWWNHSDELMADLREWIQRAADGEYIEYTANHPDPDGNRRDIEGTIRPVTDESGTVQSLSISGRDITERKRQQDELRDRQRKLDLVLSNTDTTITELNLETGTMSWDERVEANDIGSPETIEALIGRVHPDDRERIRSDLDEMRNKGDPLNEEYRVRNEAGEYRWFNSRSVPTVDDQASVVAIATDITDLKKREKRFKRSQERYRTLLEAAPDPVFVADGETGDIVEVNAAAEAILGRPRDEIIGRSRTEFHPEGDAELYREAFDRSLGSSTMVSKLPNGDQLKLRSADGGTTPVDVTVDTVELPQGSVTYGVFRDISQRKERERELELKERAMDEASVGITISDLTQDDNPLIYVNDGFVEQTGYDREEALGRNYRFLEADERDQSVVDDLRNAIAAEEPTTVELRNYRKDGEQFWNRVSMTPVYDDSGDPVNAIGIQQEVTEEKTREKRLQALLGTTRELLEADGLEEVATETVETLTTEFEFHQAAFYRREGDEIVRTAASGASTAQPPGRIERGRTPLWDAIERGKPIHHDDFVGISDGVDRGDVAAGAYFPVGDHGAIVVGAKRPDRLGESQRQLVGVLTENLQSVLDNIQQRRELINEQKRFRMLSESVEEYAFLTLDEDGDIQTWNGGAKNLFGYEADAAVGMSTSKFYPEADRESHPEKRLLQQARVAGESAHEGWLVRADGSEFYADVRYASLEAEDGTFRGFAKIVRDMTRRRHQQRRTERFVEESDDVVTIVDPDGTLTYASGSANRVLGHDPDDLVGENLFDHLHPAGREHAIQQFVTCVEDVERVRAECRFDAPDGGWIDIEGRCRNMLDDDAIEGVIVYLRDVTETKKRIRRFESIFNGTFQLTNLLDLDGTLVEANDATLEFAGVDHNAIVGTPFIDAPLWTHSDAVRDGVRDAIDRAAAGDFVRYETEVRGADGLATVDFSVKPVTDEKGDVSELVAEGRDVTEQKQHRRHLDVMQRVMRHNMRNDLNKVRGWAQMMVEESDVKKRAERFETVKEVLERWEAMVEKMKSIRSALESQQASDARKEAGSLVRDAVGQAREEEVDVAVVTDAPATESTQVPASLLEAVRELVTNAAEASADPTIEVELTRPEDGWIKISVRDDGPGMPDIEADVLETGEETPLDHGQGLGLWMVRMIVTRAGGDVLVESTADGTDVCLRLPTERAVEDEGSVETTG